MLPRSPRHGCARAYARSGLFKDLGSFADLERRIEQLPTEKDRGDAFEVFVEAYLSTDEMAQAEEVWVTSAVPGELRRGLNLPSSDYGYDGVLRTKLGELVAYQAKFRTGRTSLPYAELATFFGISEKADRRIVLTNSMAMSAVAESRTAFQTTRGGDFDRLDAAQLAAIAAWIDGIAPAPLIREPRPHQQAALTDIATELSTHDRATVVMACGTGKTLVALWAAERMQPRRVLVLVPSLSLLRQTLHEWAKWTNWGERFRYLCVCSDPTVAKEVDQIVIRPEDADFPVRTDPSIVGRFLDNGDDAVSVVFCTYQSAPVVGEAMKGKQPFDLGIFDEAHKTTGRESTRFAFALTDEHLPIRKRLFLTATPRHYDIRKRDREGDFAVASMDDEAIYGRVAHRLTFAQAAAQKIIVPYKVVISVVDSEMIDNTLLDQSEVVIAGDPVRAKWVAHQIALKRAVEDHDLKRLITFHSSIKAAAAFASDNAEGVGIHLPDFQRFHVSGAQPSAEREEHMREFARVHRGVITNARCLTEGVDVPSVDMVAFMNPRRSKVDIVQAVGRAMRTAGADKICGYVLVPLFVEMQKGETIDEAVERSDFDEIAQVLNAMRENDDELSEIIQGLSVERGKTGGFDESRLHDKVEVLGPQLQFGELAASIHARLVEELGVTWDERYGQLIAYKDAHGDCNVPTRWKDNLSLSNWCNKQRRSHSWKTLSPDRIGRLEEIGFTWDQRDAVWEEMFSALTTYKRVHGNCNVPRGSKGRVKLEAWCNQQRTTYNGGRLALHRIRQLEEIGFTWDRRDALWEEMFSALTTYKQTHGNCNVPVRWKDNLPLANWCANQTQFFKRKRLFPDRIRRLEEIGFTWDRRDALWEEMFSTLTAYKREHGDCNVPDQWECNRALGTWCHSQRAAYRGNVLSPARIERLSKLAFAWDPFDERWDEMYATLVAYKQTHGDCNVPQGWKDDPKLGTWCNGQRQDHKAGKLSTVRSRRLEQLGFLWDPYRASWEEMFTALADYKYLHGDTNVPAKWCEDRKLGAWCGKQRAVFKKGELSPDRTMRLEQLGFVWDQLEAAWEEMFATLVAYKRIHGDCHVPQVWKDDPKLGTWCAKQRAVWQRGELSPVRGKRLEEIGFPFRVRGASRRSRIAPT